MKERPPVLNANIFPSFKCRERGEAGDIPPSAKLQLQGKEDYSMPRDTLFALSTAQSVPMSGVEVEELFPHAVKP